MTISVFLMLIGSLSYAKAPDLATVNAYVAFALAAQEDKLLQDGKWSCSYVAGLNGTITGRANKVQEAQSILAARCIRQQCSEMSVTLLHAHQQLNAVTEEQFEAVVRSQGYNEEEIARAKENRGKLSAEEIANVDYCKTSATARILAFDSCFATPMECSH